MYRFALDYLKVWRTRDTRKPLVIRGARQVGKSYLVRLFAKEHFQNLVEINFERDPDLASLFASNSPSKITSLLELRFNTAISAGSTLLFLDEIQAAPSVLASLRYFHEQMTDLHVIAAGSLLEFALEDFSYSMPVGRVEYLHLGPMQFAEFLIASGHEKLNQFLDQFTVKSEIPEAIHNQLMELLRTFLVVGGMPEAIASYLKTRSWKEADAIKQSILSTYQDDFGKYGKRVKPQRLQTLFQKLPLLVGARFKYAGVDRNERAGDLAKALELLGRARVAYRVRHSAANGIPLGAEVRDQVFKVLFLDVGLMSGAWGLNLLDFEKAGDAMLVKSGAVCEQFVGQHLLYSGEPYREPELYYWVREKKNSAAEVDYLFSEGAAVVPVEVKAGKTGTLKSLQVFLREKKIHFGVRFNSDLPSFLVSETTLPNGSNIPFRFLSLPLYLVGQARRLAREVEA